MSLRYGSEVLSPQALGERLAGRLLVVIAAYNEAESLPPLLARIPSRIAGAEACLLLVDDGSSDATAAVALAAGAIVAELSGNRGQGAALRTAYELALAAGASIVVTMDADGQHRPDDLDRLAEPVISGRAAFAQGSRILGEAESNTLAREMGIAFFNRLVRMLTGAPVTDCSNSFRAIRADVLHAVELRQAQFQASELLIEAITRGFSYEEVPVTVLRRTHGTTRKPGTVRYGAGFARAILFTWWRSRRRRQAGPARQPHGVQAGH